MQWIAISLFVISILNVYAVIESEGCGHGDTKNIERYNFLMHLQ